nr:MAG TPA: hypothetical protein [Caudoviricetes sp.]
MLWVWTYDLVVCLAIFVLARNAGQAHHLVEWEIVIIKYGCNRWSFAAETNLLVLLIVLERTEDSLRLAKFLPVLSQAESVCSSAGDMEDEDGAICALYLHNMVVDALRESNRIGSTIKHYEIISVQETLNVPALVFNITEYHFANIRSFG